MKLNQIQKKIKKWCKWNWIKKINLSILNEMKKVKKSIKYNKTICQKWEIKKKK